MNVVSSASFITGHNLDAGRDRIEEACKQGGSTMFGSGVSPGFAELLAIVAANGCARVDKVTIAEASDTTFYDSPDTEIPCGFGMPIDDPNLQPMMSQGTAVFAEAVRLVADALGVELDEMVCEAEYAQTTEDVDLGSWTIKAGCVAGVFASWQGRVGGKTVVDLNVRWRKGQTLDPDWKVEGDPWKITIDGLPTVTMQVGFLPPPDFIENGQDDGRLHGARPHHHRDAADPRDPGRRRRRAGHCHLQRPAADASPRHRASDAVESAAPGEPLLWRLLTGLAIAGTVPRHREGAGMPRRGDGIAHRPGQTGE